MENCPEHCYINIASRSKGSGNPLINLVLGNWLGILPPQPKISIRYIWDKEHLIPVGYHPGITESKLMAGGGIYKLRD